MSPTSRFVSAIAAATAFALAGCAVYDPMPRDYDGPRARLSDTQKFVAVEIDGRRIASGADFGGPASYGRGFFYGPDLNFRDLPIRPFKIKVRALGTSPPIEGVVDFTPKPGKHYIVWGETKDGATSVWIAERAFNDEPLTAIVGGK